MSKGPVATKQELHPRNRHRSRYNFEALSKANVALKSFVQPNQHGNISIDFSNPEAVLELNKALLMHHYSVEHWQIPQGYLTPPIPGRADYIHLVADLLGDDIEEDIPTGPEVNILDLGVGANCIFPILGTAEYEWSFVGSEIEERAMENAAEIVQRNELLQETVELRKQTHPAKLLEGIVKPNDRFHAVICNPPFHASPEEAQKSNRRKVRNLSGQNPKKAQLNFGGQTTELWTRGGEKAFINQLIKESRRFREQVLWFTVQVSKKDSLNGFINSLKSVDVEEIRLLDMAQGQKKSRVLAWTFVEL